MKVIKLESNDQSDVFKSAKLQAKELAQKELGDNMSLVFYNDNLKLVSNHGIKCKVTEKENCGAGAYAKSFDADLEVVVGDHFKFYFRHVEDYLTTDRRDASVQYDLNQTGFQ
ncbi:MAG: AF1514 family protein [Deltaproteobacteria bacterium]|jgi:hypothetical protein|nr:AF1514 family protein [Deltaproteobacteria bacterium]MBT4639723.1 AF1514 family protein [Deltaproteobacteria bacterium]